MGAKRRNDRTKEMMKYKNIAEISAGMYELFTPPKMMKESYNLDRMIALMNLLGNPQNELKIIHVAGTSGKTSTCYFAASLLQASGCKVGLTVSPHVDTINERVQINLEPLAEPIFTKYFNEFIAIPGLIELQPSYFEAMVALAFVVFHKEKVDYAVVEVGIGGLGDGTNVITREDKVCVITDIGIDHTQILGDTIKKITAQKAGIITSKNLVVMNRQSDEVMNVVQQQVEDKQAVLEVVERKTLHIKNSLPDFQRRNFSLAQAVVGSIARRDELPALTDRQLAETAHLVIPARMEVRSIDGKTVILDGSHNKQKLQALCRGVRQQFPHKTVAILTAFITTRQDQIKEALEELVGLSDTITITEFSTKQDFLHKAVDAKIVATIASEVGFKLVSVKQIPIDALTEMLEGDQDIVLVTGSFYLLNHIRMYL